MSLKSFAPLLLLIVAAPAVAQSMNAEAFFKRGSALQKKGVMAVFSMGEIKRLTKEAKSAGERARDIRKADLAAGHPPRFCPPKGGVTIDDKEFMARLGAIPSSERVRIDMTEVMSRILAAKFPCSQ
jgi:hypothetical protein